VPEGGIVLRAAEVRPGVIRDLRIAGGRVSLLDAGTPAGPDDEVIDLAGCAVLPGLADHHLHLLSTAAAARSVDCAPPAVVSSSDLVAVLSAARRRRPEGWLRGTGYDVALAGDIDRTVLDRSGPGPLRVQDRTASWWVLNGDGLDAVLPASPADWPAGVERDGAGRPTGRLVRLDGWLRTRVSGAEPPLDAELARVGRELAAAGVTSVVDASVTNGPAELAVLAGAVASGQLPQRLSAMTGAVDIVDPPVRLGPVKVVLDDADLPSLDHLVTGTRVAHRAGRAVAFHCVTSVQLVLALTALAEAGHRAGDRIEHASVVPDDLLALLAAGGPTVVTQPGLVWRRGDRYLAEAPEEDRPFLWRVGTLRAAGVPVAGSTDAPFGPLDPWVAVRAAIDRRTAGGAIVGRREAVTATEAIDLFLGSPADPARPRRVGDGMAADLCILDGSWSSIPWVGVGATLIGGKVVHGRLEGH